MSLPLPTLFSSVPLLSLRTHPTSFPFSNSLVKHGWEGDFAHSETESWHSLLPTPGSLSLSLHRNFLFPVSCSLILEFCLRQSVPCLRITRGEVVWSVPAAVTLILHIKNRFPSSSDFHLAYLLFFFFNAINGRWKSSLFRVRKVKCLITLFRLVFYI